VSIKNYFILGVAVLLFSIGLFTGYKLYPIINPYPIVTNHTEYIVDTQWYAIHDYKPWIIRDTIYTPGDSIPMPTNIDTAAILKDYYSVYGYPWEKQDSNISFKLYTTITRNAPIDYCFDYTILRPQQIVNNNVDNSVYYYSYLQFGLDIPTYSFNADSLVKINNLALDLNYIFPKGYFGVGWHPEGNIISTRFGTTIWKRKQKK